MFQTLTFRSWAFIDHPCFSKNAHERLMFKTYYFKFAMVSWIRSIFSTNWSRLFIINVKLLINNTFDINKHILWQTYLSWVFMNWHYEARSKWIIELLIAFYISSQLDWTLTELYAQFLIIFWTDYFLGRLKLYGKYKFESYSYHHWYMRITNIS